MDPNDVIVIPLRRWRVLAACVLMAIAAGLLTLPAKIAKTANAPVSYRATAILVSASALGKGTATGGSGGKAAGGAAGAGLAQWAPVIKSDVIINAVGAQLKLKGPAITALHKSIVVKLNQADGTLGITAIGSEPVHTAAVANMVTDQFLSYLSAQDQTAYQAQLANAQRQVDDLKAQIAAAKNAGGSPAAKAKGSGKTGTLDVQVLNTQYLTAASTLAHLQTDGPPKASIVRLDNAIAVPVPTKTLFFGVPPKKSSFTLPKTKGSWMILVAGIGVLLGLIMTFVMDWLDTRFWTRADVERVLGLPVVAEVPLLRKRQAKQRSVITAQQPRSISAAAYRSLRAALLITPRRILATVRGPGASTDGPRPDSAGSPELGAEAGVILGTTTKPGHERDVRVIMVASANPGEGRTSTALNLAVCLAELGKSVVVLGYDFNRRDLSDWVKAAPSPGITDALKAPGSMRLEELAQPTGIPHVRVVPCGAGVSNPTLFLDVTRDLLREARKVADFVILDTAPGLMTYDASDMAPEVDTVVLVARAGKTRAAALIQFLDQLAQVESPMLGVVLVGTKPKVSLPRRPRRLRRQQSAHRAPKPRVSKRTRKTAESQPVGPTTQDAPKAGGGDSSPDIAPTLGAAARDRQDGSANDGGTVAEDTTARSEQPWVETTAKP